LKKIWAMGCPTGLFRRDSRSLPIQNVRETLIAQPRMPAIPMALTMAHGTAVAAFDDSSLICTLESKEPMVHDGARKLRINA